MNSKGWLLGILLGVLIIILLRLFSSAYIYHQIVDGHEITQLFPLSFSQQLSINNDPVQITINPEKKTIQFNTFILTPIATYQLRAQVLSKNRHYNTHLDAAMSSFMDSKLFPIDIALGWGLMSDPERLKHVTVTQYGRWDFWQPKDSSITNEEVMLHSDNFHMIPGSRAVFEKLNSLKIGQQVSLLGYLVNVKTVNDEYHWDSAFEGYYSGPGACRIFLVIDVKE
ncbi:MAG: hypothetical protein P4M12_12010 [Gammaproteobacteria bacterium]|nr:hypothetical protein [Gammaproteobacteria bacterium]